MFLKNMEVTNKLNFEPIDLAMLALFLVLVAWFIIMLFR